MQQSETGETKSGAHKFKPDPEAGRGSRGRGEKDKPHPDDDRKPDDIGDLTKRSWKFIAKKTVSEFYKDHCTDLAAGLTYHAVLAVFPVLIAVVSILGLVGKSKDGTNALIGIVDEVAPSAADTLSGVITQLSQSGASGFALVLGLAGALWSASGYVAAFGRAMNRIYQIREGRPFYKLRPIMLVITIVAVLMVALVAIALVVSGPLASAVGSAIGLGETAVLVWNIAKWPSILVVVVLVIAILYYTTPNIKQPKFHWISVGASVAVLVWILASLGFGVYVANFANYNKTYGALAGVVVFLLWLWLTNLALLFGAELDAEIERGRQLQAGFDAQNELLLPPKDTEAIDKANVKQVVQNREADQLEVPDHQNS